MCRQSHLVAAVVVSVLGGNSLGVEPPQGKPAVKGELTNIALKRQSEATEGDLRKELLGVPDIGLSQTHAAKLYAAVEEHVKKSTDIRPDCGRQFFGQFVSKQGNSALPWRSATDAAAGQEEAQTLHVLSNHLRDCLMKATPRGDVRPDAGKVKELLTSEKADGVKAGEWKKPQAVPTLMQLLQTENTPIRTLLIELLADIPGKEASAALAQRALFELSPEIRAKAVQALASRPASEYWQSLYDGLRYPWPAAADHAAEAIAAVELTAYLPDLVALLKAPDPRLAFPSEKKTPVVREVVRVNHMSNCMLCHAPSHSKAELVRGRVPSPGEDPPPLYYRELRGSFVRASVTYLRQEFSVVQPVASPGKWPGQQRYDYLVWTRPATPADVRRAEQAAAAPRSDIGEQARKDRSIATYPQREAVLFALRQLTKTDAGATYDQWAKFLHNPKK